MTRKNEILLFLLIIAIAAFFRLWKLDLYPPGLYPDEAMNGNNALYALDTGDFRIFYPDNNGREGLFINLQAGSVALFGNTAWALRVVSVLMGILTVAGVYFLTRHLFDRQMALLASFFTAISLWSVLFARIGFRANMAPMLVTWGLYFFFKALSSGKLRYFVLSGLAWGLGFHTYIAFRIMPLVLLVVLIAYWRAIDKDFSYAKYLAARHRVAIGLVAFVLVASAVIAPLAYHIYTHPSDFLGRTAQVSIFSNDNPARALLINTAKTLGMFNFVGDFNWRHNLSGQPLLFWPIGALFVIGFILSWIRLFEIKKKHGHYSTVHLTLLGWFFVGLAPVFLSDEGIPHALRAIIVYPVVFIFAAQGLRWLFDYLDTWYYSRDVHQVDVHLPASGHQLMRESVFLSTLVLVAFLFAMGCAEFDRYFRQWAQNPEVAGAFNAYHTQVAQQLKSLPRQKIKYVLINAGGVLVTPPNEPSNTYPVAAQGVMYLTDTWTLAKQKEKNIYYLTEDQFRAKQYNQNSVIVQLNP